jgi:Fe-S-cluster containining protein
MSGQPGEEDREKAALASQEYGKGLQSMRAGKSGALQLQLRYFKRLDDALKTAGIPGKKMACASGCSYCCHYHVLISAPEALALDEYVQTRMSDSQRAEVRSRLQDNLARIAGMTVQEHINTNVACAFLLDGSTCSVYEARPIACRKHHSYDVTPCKVTFENSNDPGGHPQSILHIAFGDGFTGNAAMEIGSQGMDFTRYEMSEAVLTALTNRAVSKRWRDGKQAFPGSRERDLSGGLPDQ